MRIKETFKLEVCYQGENHMLEIEFNNKKRITCPEIKLNPQEEL